MCKMKGKCTIRECLLLLIIISLTCALPQQDSDEVDSDEEEQRSSTSSPGSQNVTDQELAVQAALFLTNYFSNNEAPTPLNTPYNHTITITVVSHNASTLGLDSTQAQGADFSANSPQQIIDQQYQQILQQQIQQQLQFQQLQQQAVQTPPQQSQPINLTPPMDLVGFVPRRKPPQVAGVNSRGTPEQPSPNLPISATTVTTTEPPIKTFEETILDVISKAENEIEQNVTSSSLSISIDSPTTVNSTQDLSDPKIIIVDYDD